MPVRKIPKNYSSVTGLIASEKSDRLLAYESRLERYCLKLALFNRNVQMCEEQPVTISYIDPMGKSRSYTPDILITYRTDDGTVQRWKPLLAEVKYRKNLFAKWNELGPKFRAARQFAREKGWNFAVLTDAEILGSYLNNVIFLIKYRSYLTSEFYNNLILETLRERGEMTPNDLLSILAGNLDARLEMLPSLWQLIANHAIDANLDEPLTMRTVIALAAKSCAEKSEENDECLRQFGAGSGRRIRRQALCYHPPFGS